ncbi:MAG: type II toxin-antitoxin system HicB family antitoxin [Patescibacteria group bacterium]
MRIHELAVEIPVTIKKDVSSYIAYSPALDLASQGDSVQDAKRMFAEAAELFIEECERMNTLDDVLLDLGWEKIQNEWHPPAFEQTSERVRMPA